MIEEEWRPVSGYEGFYEVSDQGRVKSLSRVILNQGTQFASKEKILKAGNSQGYKVVNLYRDGDGTVQHFKVARLVAKTFLPNPEDLPIPDHVNGIKNDDRTENLEWVSWSENLKRAYAIGLRKSQKKQRTIDEKRIIQRDNQRRWRARNREQTVSIG